jgi:hypothetical protein
MSSIVVLVLEKNLAALSVTFDASFKFEESKAMALACPQSARHESMATDDLAVHSDDASSCHTPRQA